MTAPNQPVWHESAVSRDARWSGHHLHGATVWLTGLTGSGKSTVAKRIADSLPGARVAFLDMDAYYRDHRNLTLEERRRVNWDHPDAFDLDLLADHLRPSGGGRRSRSRSTTSSPTSGPRRRSASSPAMRS